MVFFQKCCCLNLKKGSTAICYTVLVQELFMFIFLIFSINETRPDVGTPRHENKSPQYFQVWMKAFNVIVVVTGLYGIQKERPHLIIPFLAYRTVDLIFMTLNLVNLRNIANAMNVEFSRMDSNDENVDFLPLVIISVLFMMGVELYFLLIVYSYYQTLIQNRNMITVDVPIIVYTPQPHDHAMYSQPPVNPYLFQPKTPYQFDISSHTTQPPPSYAYSSAMNVNKSPTEPLPPPYRA